MRSSSVKFVGLLSVFMLCQCNTDKLRTALERCEVDSIKAELAQRGHSGWKTVKKTNPDCESIKNPLDREDCIDRASMSPLMVASRSACAEGVKVLIELGADPNEKSSSGNTPLIFAVMSEDIDTVEVLLANGADKYYIRPDRHPVSDFTLKKDIKELLTK